jgi:hypothetical protein
VRVQVSGWALAAAPPQVRSSLERAPVGSDHSIAIAVMGHAGTVKVHRSRNHSAINCRAAAGEVQVRGGVDEHGIGDHRVAAEAELDWPPAHML